MMAINETIQEQLCLRVIEKRKAQLTGCSVNEYDMVGLWLVRVSRTKVGV
ncbi:MAG: hypothetical protein MUF24_13625 [Chitinophagaceae bacterium]|nr:hypothetical protein [Chitinophagaceae bacterium]